MRAGIVAWCVGSALLVAGCNPNDKSYFRSGIGTELYTVDTATATELQNIYLDYLCRQAISYIGADVPSCAQQIIADKNWPTIVQAGMNDIDARCDSYLAWLDQRKRENAGILAEIGAVRIAVDALTNPGIAPGISPIALAAVSAAFGLATNTVNNFNSLLLQVDHTTVQSVVFINRRDFRENVRTLAIENKPMAVHALRSYLTICMPMTIAANINSTVTVFQQAGSGSLQKGALVSTKTIAPPARARDHAPTGPTDRPGLEVNRPEFARFFKDYQPSKFPISTIELLQNVMCVPLGEVGKAPEVNATTAFHIAIFEETSTVRPQDARKIARDGRIDTIERDLLLGESNCNRDLVQNYFERRIMNNGAITDAGPIIRLLNKEKLPGQSDLPLTTSLNDARTRIAQVRQSIAAKAGNVGKIKDRPLSMVGQWTRDLQEALLNP
jgi:hypothetical protein